MSKFKKTETPECINEMIAEANRLVGFKCDDFLTWGIDACKNQCEACANGY